MRGEDLGQKLAVGGTAPRHRYQALHGDLRRDGARAHLLLHAFGKQFDQRQPPCYPTGTAIEPARQLLHPEAKLPLQLRQQPAFLQRRFAFTPPQCTVQQQGFGFRDRPQYRCHCVPA
jgi:hypothetical protein